MNPVLPLFVLIPVVAALAVVAYIAIGLAVLDSLDRSPRIQQLTVSIDGGMAWLLFLVWPLTVLWLLWRAYLVRGNA